MDLLSCFGSLSCCKHNCSWASAQGLMPDHSLLGFFGSEEFMVLSIVAYHLDPKAARNLNTIALPPSHLTVDVIIFFLECCASFTPDVMHPCLPKNPTFHPLVHRTSSIRAYSKMLCGLSRYFLVNMRRTFVCLLVNHGFHLAALPWISFLPRLLALYKPWFVTVLLWPPWWVVSVRLVEFF